jgi:NAD(P)-dependent dehydrogenase (short-subunit alcohol dehydrogenase family)
MGVLDGKITIITGATSGIGERTAELFVEAGARVVIAGRRREVGEAVAARLGQSASFVRTDVSIEDDMKALVEGTVARFGRLDCLFNNAGSGGPPVSITELDIAKFDALMGVLVRSVAIGMKYAGIAMLKQGSGSIINTSSIGAWRAGGASHTYCAAKAAVSHLTRCVAIELGEHGIRVNSISPGAIVTGIFAKGAGLDADAADRTTQGLMPRFAKAQPIPRAGLPDDIARAALYLASDASSFVNGHDLVVDGGMIAGTRFSQTLAGRREMYAALKAEIEGG